ncbi:MAG TPA: Crp/Fnr family transcriptional regulator [Rhizomicrobium sp.]|nr:Crp/Fnr family transcriptional regulator [Rhizomicrobium sp.]
MASQVCRFCQARARNICRAMSAPHELAALESARSGTVVMRPHETIYRQGAPVGDIYNVLSGWVALYQSLDDGRRQITALLLPGDVFGIEPDGLTATTCSAEALTSASLCVIPRERAAALRARFPAYGETFLQFIGREYTLATEHLTSVGRRSALERIAHLLMEIVTRVKRHYPLLSGESAQLPLTQTEIGDMLGLTGVHVNRMLRQLREDGLVDVQPGSVRILDADRLARVAGAVEGVFAFWSETPGPDGEQAPHRARG